jgi:hypothetical protein
MPLPDLPHPPQQFIDRAYDIIREVDLAHDNNTFGRNYDQTYLDRIITKGNVKTNSRVQHGYPMGEDWEHWVKENIISDYIETSLRVSLSKNQTVTHGPHCDNPDKWKLYYLVDQGTDGEDAVTSFYHEPGKPVEITGNSYETGHYYTNDVDQLNPLLRVKFPLRQWIVLNGLILHGVDNVGVNRTNLQISIRPNAFNFTIGK